MFVKTFSGRQIKVFMFVESPAMLIFVIKFAEFKSKKVGKFWKIPQPLLQNSQKQTQFHSQSNKSETKIRKL